MNRQVPTAQIQEVPWLTEEDHEWAEFLAEIIETGRSGDYEMVK